MSHDTSFIVDFSHDDFTIKYQHVFYDYWLKVRGDRLMPCRNDISPHDIVPILPMIMMFDYDKECDDFTIRLSGTSCSEMIGEYKGQKLTSLEFYDEVADRLRWCVKNKKPYYLKSTLETINKKHINYSSIVLPLSEDGKNVNIIILAIHFF